MVALVMALNLLSAIALAAGDLDGTQWKMHEGKLPIGKADTLKFDAGKFTSTECIPYGFTSGPYESNKEGDKVTWSALQTNAKGEKMDWHGSLMANKMTGSYTYTDEKGKVSTKQWSGKPSKKS
jgi:hypothetical protein